MLKKLHPLKNFQRRNAYTIIEIMVVVIIMATLSMVAVTQYYKTVEQSRAELAKNILISIAGNNRMMATGNNGFMADLEKITNGNDLITRGYMASQDWDNYPYDFYGANQASNPCILARAERKTTGPNGTTRSPWSEKVICVDRTGNVLEDGQCETACGLTTAPTTADTTSVPTTTTANTTTTTSTPTTTTSSTTTTTSTPTTTTSRTTSTSTRPTTVMTTVPAATTFAPITTTTSRTTSTSTRPTTTTSRTTSTSTRPTTTTSRPSTTSTRPTTTSTRPTTTSTRPTTTSTTTTAPTCTSCCTACCAGLPRCSCNTECPSCRPLCATTTTTARTTTTTAPECTCNPMYSNCSPGSCSSSRPYCSIIEAIWCGGGPPGQAAILCCRTPQPLDPCQQCCNNSCKAGEYTCASCSNSGICEVATGGPCHRRVGLDLYWY